MARNTIARCARDPRVDFALKLPDQRLERIDLAKSKSPEQIHEPLYSLLRRRTDWVTSFVRFGERRVRPQMIQTAASDGKAPQCRILWFLRA